MRFSRRAVILTASLFAGFLTSCGDPLVSARQAYEAKDYTAAMERYRRAAAKGNAEANFMIGLMYSNGEGVERSNEEAIAWYRKAADAGHRAAQRELGRCYFKGEGVPKDRDQAIRWFREAGKQGDAVSQYLVGLIYFHSDRDGDVKEAISWLQKAADQGDSDAFSLLGLAHYAGRGVPKDKVKGTHYWSKAAEMGDAEAREYLAMVAKNPNAEIQVTNTARSHPTDAPHDRSTAISVVQNFRNVPGGKTVKEVMHMLRDLTQKACRQDLAPELKAMIYCTKETGWDARERRGGWEVWYYAKGERSDGETRLFSTRFLLKSQERTISALDGGACSALRFNKDKSGFEGFAYAESIRRKPWNYEKAELDESEWAKECTVGF